jgi:hypothetical protein
MTTTITPTTHTEGANPATPAAPLVNVAQALEAELVARVHALSHEVRDELVVVGDTVDFLFALGRKIRILPIAFVLLWPFMLPWLVARLVRVQRLWRQPGVRDVVERSRPLRREEVWDRDADAHDPWVRRLIALREATVMLSYSIVGPGVISAGFALAIYVLMRR